MKKECNCEKNCKETYTCAVCGKEFNKLEDRIACETKCVKERKEAEQKRKQLELETKKKERKAEVDKAYEAFLKLESEYVADYGSYRFNKTYRDTPASEFEKFWMGW